MNWKTTSLTLILCALAVAASFRALEFDTGRLPAASLARHTAVVDAETIAMQRAAIIAAAAQNAVAYVNAARGELHVGNIPSAKRYLAQAGGILAQIRNALYADHKDSKAGEGLRVALWAEVSLRDEDARPANLRLKLEEATAHAIQGEHDMAVERLATLGVGALYSYIDMPLDATLGRLDAAREALKNGDAAKALALLDAATDGLYSETLEIGASGEGQSPDFDDT